VSIVSLENVTRQYRAEPVLDGVTLGLERGEKVGVIGANGSGKSTLLRIIAGREPVDRGRVVVARGTTVAWLAQNPALDGALSVLDAVFAASTEIMGLLHDYEAACRALSEGGDPTTSARVADLASRLEASGGWDLETNARTVLNHLGLGDVSARVGSLSGGQRKRVGLAHVLISRPDLLLLDEPTNHLDTDAIDWLERWLASYSGTLMLVTHDRYFLDRVTNRTLEIEGGRVFGFVGNYQAYLEKKQEQEAMRAASEEKRANLIRRELEWLKRGPRARQTKQKARLERAAELMEAPREGGPARLDIEVAGRRLGKRTVELKRVSKAFDGRPIVSDFSYTFKRGDRVGIVGPNGSGKTTLLEMIAGRLAPDGGEVETGPTVVIGYYDQESRELDDAMRVLDYVREEGDAIEMADGRVVTAAQLCERFLFSGAAQHAPIGRLSGGEKRRLYLLRVLMRNPNVLLLDEPTNDLDIPTLRRLEDYLEGFGGVLVAVSHDRYFLDRTVESIFRFEGEGRLREYAGNYSMAAEAWSRTPPPAARKAAAEAPPPAVLAPSPERRRKMSMREKLEMQSLEEEIERGEARRRELEQALASGSSDYLQTQAWYDELQPLAARLDAAMERWSALSELPQ
jgi:ATP-binding cassette subfamily F protein uup